MHEASEVLQVALPIASVGALAATISIARVWVRRGDGTTQRTLEGPSELVEIASHDKEAR